MRNMNIYYNLFKNCSAICEIYEAYHTKIQTKYCLTNNFFSLLIILKIADVISDDKSIRNVDNSSVFLAADIFLTTNCYFNPIFVRYWREESRCHDIGCLVLYHTVPGQNSMCIIKIWERDVAQR